MTVMFTGLEKELQRFRADLPEKQTYLDLYIEGNKHRLNFSSLVTPSALLILSVRVETCSSQAFTCVKWVQSA